MLKKFKTANISTVIFFTVIFIFSLGAIITKSYSFQEVLIVSGFISVIYITLTRRFYIMWPIISIYGLLSVIASVPMMAYEVLGEDPSFIIASAPLAFFATLWASNSAKLAELSIKNPWVANIWGLVGLYFVEVFLLMIDKGFNQIAVGIIGFLVAIIISYSYLAFSPKSWVNSPTKSEGDNLNHLLVDKLKRSGYENLTKKDKEISDILIDTLSDEKYMAHLYPIDDLIYVKSENKKLNKFVLRQGIKEKRAYPWLFRIAVSTYEARHKGKVNKEVPIIIQSVSSPEEHTKIEIIDIPINRSKKTYPIGIMTLSKSEKQNKKSFNELFLSLKLKQNGESE